MLALAATFFAAQTGVICIDGLAVGCYRGGAWHSVNDKRASIPGAIGIKTAYQLGMDGASKKVSSTLKFVTDDGPEGLISWYTEPESEGAVWFGSAPKATKMSPIAADNTVYLKVVGDYLVKKGLKTATPRINDAYRVDLDGNGTEEVVIFATSRPIDEMRNTLSLEGKQEEPKDYAMVLVRYISGKGTKIAELCYTDGRKGSLEGYWTSCCLANLDGKTGIEIAVKSTYYEAGGGLVFGFKNGKVTTLAENVVGV